jgi:hypothetical protein
MTQTAKQQHNQFHTTQQLGFKQILYCWCGASCDMNKNSKQALRQFYLAHADVCEPKVSKQAVK